MRILDLSPSFLRDRQLYARLGSLHDAAVRKVLRQLASEASALPLPGDEIDLPSPYTTIWAHRIPGAQLVLTYTFRLPRVRVQTLRPDLRAG